MAWARLHDGAMRHPKIAKLIDWKNPFCVWMFGLAYAQEHLTDGVIVKAAMHPRAIKTAAVLVERGLWTDHGDAFLVHDYLDWNDSRVEVLRKREQARTRTRRHRNQSDVTRDDTRTLSSGVSVTASSDVSTQEDPEGMQGEPADDRRIARERRMVPRRSGEFGRIFLHRWQLENLIATLGEHAESFNLDMWLDALTASIAGKALPPDPWKFVKSELDLEIRRRGLAVAEATPAAPTNKRIAGLMVGGEAFLKRAAERRQA